MANKTPIERGLQGALQRGKACLRCRKRKMRCDGSKPACQQCTHAKKGDICEYDDGKGKTRTQLLRENITRLEQRIRELEDPEYVSSAITLHDPHASSCSASASSSFGSPGGNSKSQSPFPSEPTGSPHDTWSHLPSVPSPSPSPFGEGIFFPDHNVQIQPPIELSQMLLDIVAPHRTQCGLAISIEQIRDSLTLPASAQFHPALMNAIYLWACYISRPEPLSHHEDHYLSHALDALRDALRVGDRVLDAIQASCLLATYFLATNRLIEGSYHASAATSLAVQYRLHGVPSEDRDTYDLMHLKGDNRSTRRTLVFWQVYNLDACWSVVLRKPSVLPDGHLFRCPWPPANFELDHIDNCHAVRTIGAFLDGELCPTGFSTPALRVKASAMFSRADQLSETWSTLHLAMSPSHTLREEVQALENTINQFIPALIPVHQLNVTLPEDKCLLIVAHTLAHGAVIRLHRQFAQEDSTSFNKCSRAARACLSVIKHIADQDFDFLDPIVAPCWSYAADALIRELDTIETSWPLMNSSAVRNEIASILYALTALNTRFPIAAVAIPKIQKRLAQS